MGQDETRMENNAPSWARNALSRAHVLCVAEGDEAVHRWLRAAGLTGTQVDSARNMEDALTRATTRAYAAIVLDETWLEDALFPTLCAAMPLATYIALSDAQSALPEHVMSSHGMPPEELTEVVGRAQLLQEERHLSSPSLRPVSSPRKDETHILLLEDNPRDARIVEERVREAKFEGFTFERATRLDEALHALAQKKFALVLSDLSLPDARGLDAAAALHQAAPDTPLVVLTHLPDDVTALQAVRLGAQDILVKSELSAETLRRTLRAAVERKALQEQLEHRTRVDPLTGLLNRVALVDQLERAILRARVSQTKMAVMYLDLNGFKQINDTLGHQVGDAVLRSVTDRLRGCARDTDAVARLGGDEFTVLCEHLRAPTDAMAIASRINEALRDPVQVGERSLAVGASIGLAFFPEDGEDADTLLRHADEAMYRAKRGTRDGFVCYGDATSDQAMTLQRYEQELRQSFAKKDLRLSRHWMLGLIDGATLGWLVVPEFRASSGVQIEAATVHRLLESAGIVEAASRLILNATCELAEATPEPLLVRVTSLLLRDPDVRAQLGGDAHARQTPGRSVELVIGQEEVRTDHVRDEVSRALRAGVRIWLSDYGRRDLDLKLLSRLPGLRGVLLDTEWCRELHTESSGLSLLRAFTSALETLGMRAVAPACEIPTSWFLSGGCHAVVSGVALHLAH